MQLRDDTIMLGFLAPLVAFASGHTDAPPQRGPDSPVDRSADFATVAAMIADVKRGDFARARQHMAPSAQLSSAQALEGVTLADFAKFTENCLAEQFQTNLSRPNDSITVIWRCYGDKPHGVSYVTVVGGRVSRVHFAPLPMLVDPYRSLPSGPPLPPRPRLDGR
jgi:hypothetical protein